MPRSSARGRVTVYIDGVKVATVDTYYKTDAGAPGRLGEDLEDERDRTGSSCG